MPTWAVIMLILWPPVAVGVALVIGRAIRLADVARPRPTNRVDGVARRWS